jgi:hypothetical protein
MEPASRRPGPGARVVSRPSLLALIIWPYITLIAVALLIPDSIGLRILGALMLVLCLFALLRLALARVWVDGDLLYTRGIANFGPPINLARLTRAELSSFGRNSGRTLFLADADGQYLTLEVTNTSVRRLWPVLAQHIHWDTPVANETLRKRLVKHWPPPPLGPGE